MFTDHLREINSASPLPISYCSWLLLLFLIHLWDLQCIRDTDSELNAVRVPDHLTPLSRLIKRI